MRESSRERIELRELVINQVKWFSLVLGTFTFLDTFNLQLTEGKYLLVTVYSVVFVCAMSMLFIKRIPTNIRATVLVAMIYVVGLTALIDEGIFGGGPLWLIAFPSVTAALLGKRKAVVAIAISFSTAVINLYISHQPLDYSLNFGLDYISHGLDQSFDILLLAFVTSIPTASLFEKLHFLFVKEKEQSGQLSDAIHQLVEANNELDAFAHTVSHDLRSPIRHIGGFAELAETSLTEDDLEGARTSLIKIKSSAERASRLIEEIMRFSKISSFELNVMDVNLSTMAKKCAQNLKLDPMYQKFEVSVAEGMVLKGDKELISIIINNLLGNAFKFSQMTGHPRVEVGEKKEKEEKVYFVRDNGIGFDNTKVQKLFEPFSRFHSSRQYDGFGVGLATVKKIVDRHGGRIWAEGSEGQGATFYFTLPSI